MIILELFKAFIFYFIFFCFAFIGLPITKKIFSSKIVAFGFAKLAGLLIFAYFVWLLSSLHFISYQNNLLITAFWTLGIFFGLYFLKPWEKFNIKEILPIIYFELACFFIFLLYLYLRSFNPAIYGTERFMDMMLFSASSKTNFFPFIDSWFAGNSINYYYYGSFLFSLITKFAHTPLPLAYNFSFALLFSQVFTGAGLFVYEFTKKINYALLAAFLLSIAGSSFYAGCVINSLQNPKIPVCSYASSTRLYTPSYIINEIPSYSFTVGDMHAHVMGLMIFLLNLILLAKILKNETPNYFAFLLLSFSLASNAMTNAWDFISASSLLVLILLFKLFRFSKAKFLIWQKENKHWIPPVLTVIFSALVLMLPFLMSFKSPVLGIRFVPNYVKLYSLQNVQWPTPFLAELGMWGLLVFGCLLSFGIIKKDKEKWQLPGLWLIMSLFIIVGVEIFFIPDIYSVANPPYFRANTVFKFGFHAWAMLTLAFCLFLFEALKKISTLNAKNKFLSLRFYLKFFLLLATLLIIISGLFYPYQAIKQFYLTNNSTRIANLNSLDGSNFMKKEGIEDFYVVRFINKNYADRIGLLEAAGDGYKYFGRISAFTGSINPINWLTHEWTWRLDAKAALKAQPHKPIETGYGKVAKIKEDVETIYNTKDENLSLTLLKKYNINYVYIGTLERQTYPNLSEEKFYKLGQIVYSINNSKLIKINNSPSFVGTSEGGQMHR